MMPVESQQVIFSTACPSAYLRTVHGEGWKAQQQKHPIGVKNRPTSAIRRSFPMDVFKVITRLCSRMMENLDAFRVGNARQSSISLRLSLGEVQGHDVSYAQQKLVQNGKHPGGHAG